MTTDPAIQAAAEALWVKFGVDAEGIARIAVNAARPHIEKALLDRLRDEELRDGRTNG